MFLICEEYPQGDESVVALAHTLKEARDLIENKDELYIKELPCSQQV